MLKLFLSPHNDDETLFGAFTLMREKPLVAIVTDSWIQYNRGENVTAEERWEETKKAMEILGCSVIRLGIKDDEINELLVEGKLNNFSNFEQVYAPAIQGGNPHHDLIGKMADKIFGNKCKHYTTYTKENLWTPGTYEIVPSEKELGLKAQALLCYTSQLRINAPHFEAVKGKSEWYI